MKKSESGFTLLELLLVSVIISAMIIMSINFIQQQTDALKIDKTSAQMEQILSAGLSYYVNNSSWPNGLSCLQGQSGCPVQYLPSVINSPFGAPYTVGTSGSLFYVALTLPIADPKGAAIGKILAGKLPLASTSSAAAGGGGGGGGPAKSYTTITTYVNQPGQNISNATAVNYAGVIHHGGCIPVPACPATNSQGLKLIPQVMVAPISVSGVNQAGNKNLNVYPISSFTAYARGPSANPTACDGSTADSTPTCSDTSPGSISYWRGCLQVVTEMGQVGGGTNAAKTSWGQYVSLMAITRCMVEGESTDSDYTNFYSN